MAEIEIYTKDWCPYCAKAKGLTIRNNKSGEIFRLDVEGVFIEIGLFPNTDFLIDLVETNELGEIRVDNHGQTPV